MRRLLLLLVLSVVSSLLVMTSEPRPAYANGRFPASNAVIFDSRDPKTIWVRVTFGLLVSHDSGQSWHWICERAIGFSGMEDPTYTITPKGTLVGGTFSGIAVSRDNGCTFTFAAGPGGNDPQDAAPPTDPKPLRRARHHGAKARPLSDLAMRANGDILGMSSTYAKAGPNNTSLFDNHLMLSTDDAQLFAESGGPIDPTLLLESIEISEADPARIYLSAVRGSEPERAGVFLVSLNAGMSWIERKIDLIEGETAPFIANVDPKNADRVYVRTHNAVDKPTRLLVTDDAGKTWKKVYETKKSPLVGFAMTADGSRVFVGSKEGVATSPTDTFNFTQGSSADIQCLGHGAGPLLWACSSEKSGFFVGASKGNGGSFDAKLHLEDLKGVLECPAESTVADECTPEEWTKQRRALGLPDPNEASAKNVGPGGPALKGRQTRTRSGGNRFGAVAGIALVGIAGYYILKRLRRGR